MLIAVQVDPSTTRRLQVKLKVVFHAHKKFRAALIRLFQAVWEMSSPLGLVDLKRRFLMFNGVVPSLERIYMSCVYRSLWWKFGCRNSLNSPSPDWPLVPLHLGPHMHAFSMHGCLTVPRVQNLLHSFYHQTHFPHYLPLPIPPFIPHSFIFYLPMYMKSYAHGHLHLTILLTFIPTIFLTLILYSLPYFNSH